MQMASRLGAPEATGALWGVQVVSLRTGRVWFETNAGARMIPASNTKLFTAALALDRLGPEHRLMTTLQVTAPPDADGRLAGPLRIVGGGDPSWSARWHGGSWTRAWAPLVRAVRQAGIRQVDGGLICDDSRFQGPPFGSGWDWDDLAGSYGAPVSALSAGDNTVTLTATPGSARGAPVHLRLAPAGSGLVVENRVITGAERSPVRIQLYRLPGDSRLAVTGSVPPGKTLVIGEASVPTPALWFGTLFREALERDGIRVAGPSRHGATPDPVPGTSADAGWQPVGSVPSPPVKALVREMMKTSQNLHAQLLLLAVGADERSHRATAAGNLTTTEEAGLTALPALLQAVGIPKGEVYLEEGSGLSRKNLATPRSLVRLLANMQRHSAASAWMASLPVGGVDGTLQSRFSRPGLKGNVRAKTGALRHVQALSGYLTNSIGEPLIFSIVVNNRLAVEGHPGARETVDALVESLALSAVREP